MIEVILFLFIVGASVITIVRLIKYFGRRASHTVVEYQRAVLFRNGKPVSVVATGRYTLTGGRDVLVVGDVRPTSINIEDQKVSLRDGAFAHYSFFAAVSIKDFKRALYSARNYPDMPHYILLRDVRATLARQTRDLILGARSAERAIQQRAMRDLEQCGYALDQFNLLSVQVFLPEIPISEQTPPALLN